MARKSCPDNPPCPRCGATHIIKNGNKNGRQRWVCRTCNRSFGTPMYRLHNTPTEVARTLLGVMRRESLSAAEEITGHKHETIGRWLRATTQHAEQITEALVRDRHLTAVKVDAFGSFVKKVCPAKRRACGDGSALGMPKSGACHALWGGLGVCGFGGCGGAVWGGADAATNGGARGHRVGQGWTGGLSAGGSPRVSGCAASGQAGASALGVYGWRGLDAGGQASLWGQGGGC